MEHITTKKDPTHTININKRKTKKQMETGSEQHQEKITFNVMDRLGLFARVNKNN